MTGGPSFGRPDRYLRYNYTAQQAAFRFWLLHCSLTLFALIFACVHDRSDTWVQRQRHSKIRFLMDDGTQLGTDVGDTLKCVAAVDQ